MSRQVKQKMIDRKYYTDFQIFELYVYIYIEIVKKIIKVCMMIMMMMIVALKKHQIKACLQLEKKQ